MKSTWIACANVCVPGAYFCSKAAHPVRKINANIAGNQVLLTNFDAHSPIVSLRDRRRTTTPEKATSNATSNNTGKPTVIEKTVAAINPAMSATNTIAHPSKPPASTPPKSPKSGPPLRSSRIKSAHTRTAPRNTKYESKKLSAYLAARLSIPSFKSKKLNPQPASQVTVKINAA